MLYINFATEWTVVDVEESGKVYAFGDNMWGQLGLGHCRPVRKPVRIKGKYARDLLLIVNSVSQ